MDEKIRPFLSHSIFWTIVSLVIIIIRLYYFTGIKLVSMQFQAELLISYTSYTIGIHFSDFQIAVCPLPINCIGLLKENFVFFSTSQQKVSNFAKSAQVLINQYFWQHCLWVTVPYKCNAGSTFVRKCSANANEACGSERNMSMWMCSQCAANSIRACGKCSVNSWMLPVWRRCFKEKYVRNAGHTFN